MTNDDKVPRLPMRGVACRGYATFLCVKNFQAPWVYAINGFDFLRYACPTAPAELDDIGDTDTADIGKLARLMPVGRGHTFVEIVRLCDETGLFERYTNQCDENNHWELLRSAKTGFSRLLKGYNQRVIAPGLTFVIYGEGHARRYAITDAARSKQAA